MSPSPKDSKSPQQFPLAALTRFAASSSRSRPSVMLPILVNVRLKRRTRTSFWPPFKSPMPPVIFGRCSHVKFLWKVVWDRRAVFRVREDTCPSLAWGRHPEPARLLKEDSRELGEGHAEEFEEERQVRILRDHNRVKGQGDVPCEQGP